MSAAITRDGIDPSTGHAGWPPRPTDSAGQGSVYVNGILATVVGAHYPTHCNESCHDGLASAGSSSVFVGGINIHRVGDAISCGDASGNGSPNVFAG